jgi:hypothetical protein
LCLSVQGKDITEPRSRGTNNYTNNYNNTSRGGGGGGGRTGTDRYVGRGGGGGGASSNQFSNSGMCIWMMFVAIFGIYLNLCSFTLEFNNCMHF